MNELVDTLVQTIAARREPERRAPEPVKPEPAPDYREMFDPNSDKFNPQAAVADITQRNYGSLINDISGRANEGMYMRFREEYPDFKEFEPDIRKLLTDSRQNNPSPEQINGLYFAAKGYRSTMKEKQDRETLRTKPPAPAKKEEATEEPLDVDEVKVAKRMFSRSENPEKAYREYVKKLDQQDTTMKVPLSGGVKR
jgi:hypothetical protein